MEKKSRIVKYSTEKLATMRARGQSRTDWTKSAAMTTGDIETSIASDVDEAGMIIDGANAKANA